MDAVAIDLGDVGHAPVAVLPRASPILRRRRARLTGVVLAVCAVIGGVAAAAPPPARPTLVFSAPFGQAIGVKDETLYLGTADTEVTAYELASGAVRWRTTVPHLIQFISAIGGLVALSWDERCRETNRVTGLDPATGKVLWTRQGGFAWAARPALLMWRPDGHCTPIGGVAPPGGILDLVDPATGQASHSIPADDGRWTVGPTGATILTWDVRGELTEWDIATGARHERGPMPALAREPYAVGEAMATIVAVGNVWLVVSPLMPEPSTGRQVAVVNAYSRVDATPLWERVLDDVIWQEGVYANDCGGVLCVVNFGQQTVSLDPRTGVRTDTVAGDVLPLPGTGYAVALSSDARLGVPASPLVDASSGKPDPTGWYVLSGMVGTERMVLARQLADRFDFATMDPATGRMRPLGALGGEIYSACDAAGDYLTCVGGSQVSVWHVR
jgi:hypothetical protein